MIFVGTVTGCAVGSRVYAAHDAASAMTCASKDYPAGGGWRLSTVPPGNWPFCVRCPGRPPLGDYVFTGYQPAFSAQEAQSCVQMRNGGCAVSIGTFNC